MKCLTSTSAGFALPVVEVGRGAADGITILLDGLAALAESFQTLIRHDAGGEDHDRYAAGSYAACWGPSSESVNLDDIPLLSRGAFYRIKGYANWTLTLLQERVVELSIVESVSRETLRKSLKKNGMTQRKIQYLSPNQFEAKFSTAPDKMLA